MAGLFDAIKSLFGQEPLSSGGFKVLYSSDGRSGHVHYRSKECNLEMYYEFGGGDVVASIDVPSPTEWTAKTGLPLERRMPILNNIGNQVVKDQTIMGRGSFEIHDNWIYIKS